MSLSVEKTLAAPETSVILKKYTFDKDTRLLLVKSVREFDVHPAGCGEKEKIHSSIRPVH